MNIILKIDDIRNQFKKIHNKYPNCIKLGEKEVRELEDYLKFLGDKKPKVYNGLIILDMYVIKAKDESLIKVEIIEVKFDKWETAMLNLSGGVQLGIES